MTDAATPARNDPFADPPRDPDLDIPGLARHRATKAERAREAEARRARRRLRIAGFLMGLAFVALFGRIIVLGLPGEAAATARAGETRLETHPRANIRDRAGRLLAADLPTWMLLASPGDVDDPEATAAELIAAFPRIPRDRLVQRLTGTSGERRLAGHLTPAEVQAIHERGLPGVHFRRAERRVYPSGREAAHVIGYVGDENLGLAGAELQYDESLRAGVEADLSIDLAVQHAVLSALQRARLAYDALVAVALVMDVETGEILALASLPDFDPNNYELDPEENRLNRAVTGVYEMGSTFKTFTIANALENGVATLGKSYDARKPIKVHGHTIGDFHAKRRRLTVAECYKYSSNICAAKIAAEIGTGHQMAFLARLDLLDASPLAFPGVARPTLPRLYEIEKWNRKVWGETETMTISFGHGLAVSPVQLAAATAMIANGGYHVTPTLARQPGRPTERRVVLSRHVSAEMMSLMRLVVEDGTGRRADVAGYHVGGKTGSAEMAKHGRYDEKALFSSFLGVFPTHAPRYVVFAALEEPRPRKPGEPVTGGRVAAPIVGEIVARIAPMLGVAPSFEAPGEDGLGPIIRHAALQ